MLSFAMVVLVGVASVKSPIQAPSVNEGTVSYWAGTASDGSTFVLEIEKSGKVRLIPTTGVISRGVWKQTSDFIDMELNNRFIRLRAAMDDGLLRGSALTKQGAAWTWTPKKQPYILATSAPEYPPLARAARVEGYVSVDVNLDEAGGVATVQIINGHPLLRMTCEQAARRFRFQSGPQSDRVARLTFVFRLIDIDDEKLGNTKSIVLSPYQIETRKGWTIINKQRSKVVTRRTLVNSVYGS